MGSGFLEVTQDSVTVLSDLAVDEDNIDEMAVARALEKARKALAKSGRHPRIPDGAAALQLSILNSTAQLELKRRKRLADHSSTRVSSRSDSGAFLLRVCNYRCLGLRRKRALRLRLESAEAVGVARWWSERPGRAGKRGCEILEDRSDGRRVRARSPLGHSV